MPKSNPKQVVVITGTSRGIGCGLSELFLKKGYTVEGCSRSDTTLKHERCTHSKIDVSNEDQVCAWIRQIKKRQGQIDVLINNAGFAPAAIPFTMTSGKVLEETLRTNVMGSYIVSREAALAMDKLAHQKGLACSVAVGKGYITYARAGDLAELIKKELKKNKYYLTKVRDLKKPPALDQVKRPVTVKITKKTSTKELCPILKTIPRDMVSDGSDALLKALAKVFPMRIENFPTGAQYNGWPVPEKWTCYEACLETTSGEKILSYTDNLACVASYSKPFEGKVSRQELFEHLYTDPENSSKVPSKFIYYGTTWGFCLTHKQYKALKEETYEVVINSTLQKGSLTFGEVYLPGEHKDEFLVSTYTCHPSLCNDNLSGVVLATFLAKLLKGVKRKYSYRFLFIPETIGSITWLSLNKNKISRIKHGLVATCVGDSGRLTYKRSRRGNAAIDRIAEKVLADSGDPHTVIDFFPSGSDERQYGSPGFNLPVGSLLRSLYGHGGFEEYHTSADDLKCVKAKYLADSFEKYWQIIGAVESDERYLNLNPKCEPQLGRRGLYRTIGSQRKDQVNDLAMFWLLNFSDGEHSLSDISVKSRIDLGTIKNTAKILKKHKLLKKL